MTKWKEVKCKVCKWRKVKGSGNICVHCKNKPQIEIKNDTNIRGVQIATKMDCLHGAFNEKN